jgi:hypothetical protein
LIKKSVDKREGSGDNARLCFGEVIEAEMGAGWVVGFFPGWDMVWGADL